MIPRIERPIAIVEHDEFSRVTIGAILQELGVDPKLLLYLPTLETAGKYFQQENPQKPSVILMDLVWQGKDRERTYSYPLIKGLKGENSVYKDVPVIVITADDREEIKQECLRLGASAVILKPFKIEEFEEVVSKTLNPNGR